MAQVVTQTIVEAGLELVEEEIKETVDEIVEDLIDTKHALYSKIGEVIETVEDEVKEGIDTVHALFSRIDSPPDGVKHLINSEVGQHLLGEAQRKSKEVLKKKFEEFELEEKIQILKQKARQFKLDQLEVQKNGGTKEDILRAKELKARARKELLEFISNPDDSILDLLKPQ